MKRLPANAKDFRRPGLRLVAPVVAALATLLGSGNTWAARVENTAQVSFAAIDTGPQTLHSNTVAFDILPSPSPADIEFRRFDPGAVGGDDVPAGGGQCLVDGGYIPLPPVEEGDGTPVDPEGGGTSDANGYYIGEPVVIAVTDGNRNTDPAVRELVEVAITTGTGDAESLRLQETDVDTGVFAGAIQSRLMPPAPVQYDCVLSLEAGAEIVARYTDSDFPLDAVATAVATFDPPPSGSALLRLEQVVSRQVVEIGDFLQYTLVLHNVRDVPAFATRISDVLPAGVRYRAGSLRLASSADGVQALAAPASARMGTARLAAASEPQLAADGRSLLIPVGDLPGGATITATFVAEVGAAARGPELLNGAVASASGKLSSNATETTVRVKEALATSAFTIVGRVTEAAGCEVPAEQRKGVANVRVLLEDGTYVTTDLDGAYHFEGVRPGTHVAQLDIATLPGHLVPDDCLRNTRHAGRGYSQFVEAQGGMLVRADFFVAPAAPATVKVGVKARAEASGARMRHVVELDGSGGAVSSLKVLAILAKGAAYVAGSARLDGQPVPEPEITGNFATFRLPDPGADWARTLAFEVAPGECDGDGDGGGTRLVAMFEAGGGSGRTPPAEVRWRCDGAPPGPGVPVRVEASAHAAAAGPAASPSPGAGEGKPAIMDEVAAAGGGERDWLAGQSAGREWLFPAADYNPRSPVTRVVVKRLESDKVALRINGVAVDGLAYEGTQTSPAGFAAAIWRSVHLREGGNLLEAVITDAGGQVVATLSREIHYSVDVARAEFLPERSRLVADGLVRPVVAVRMLDRFGKPARHGLSGTYSITAPHAPAAEVGEEEGRRFAGLERAQPTWQVEGDEGIAWIELQPTTSAGSFTLGFDFATGPANRVHQEIEGWLKAEAREWIVVGFAKGSVGYDTLVDNMQALPEGEDGSGVRADGQVALYAKGRVLGDWLLTLAYDSDKRTGDLRRRGLLSTIDPQQYYTLYGDGTSQGHDAASVEKLYLKLERDQFYAMFGDFQTGLDRGELSRYQRTLNGVKVEYRGRLVEFNGFAARTSQAYARDELPGDGTSGLYRLTRRGVLINSERVRLETRDRYHGEQILASRELQRHIDYDIDYDNGTLFFREPIASRDFDFNPNFIVVEYETRGTATEYLNAGGRAGVRLMDGRLEAGVSYIRDEDMAGRSRLAAVDAKFRLTAQDELRAEAANTRGDDGAADTSGNAWLLEWEHRGERLNLLAYARRQGLGFGLGQQNHAEAGMFKAGVQGQWRVGERFSLQGEAYRLENLASGAVRTSLRAEAVYKGDDWGARAGLQWARDEAVDGRVEESRQVTLGANRYFLDRKLELSAQADLSLGGRNDSVDFPTRFQVAAAYAITPSFRVLAAHEVTDGETRDTSTTRVGFEATPWANTRLTSTLNQSRITEYGPRTFALFGLDQKVPLNERWSLDFAIDSSRAFNESGEAPLVVDPAQPIAAGGIRDGGALTEDFVALSGGATYRTELWSWNVRAEGRSGASNDRHGFTTAFLRQVRDGVALAASMQAFSQRNDDGSTGLLANAQLSWAYRPSGSRWSMLDKLEYRLDEITRGQGEAILGQDTLVAVGNARSSRLVNNFVLNYVSDAWQAGDGQGNVFALDQRSQLSLYYGSRYVLDSFGSDDYSGYSDILGAEWRFDLTPRIDIGVRASVLHSWSQDTYAWAVGPSLGFSPFTNAWVSVGYNVRGFQDRDFEQAHHTAEGAYMVLRLKFDQDTFGLATRGGSTGR